MTRRFKAWLTGRISIFIRVRYLELQQCDRYRDTDGFVDRLSGLWGAQTPLGIWLEENQMTTLFFGGVNADQCVVSSTTTITVAHANLGA